MMQGTGELQHCNPVKAAGGMRAYEQSVTAAQISMDLLHEKTAASCRSKPTTKRVQCAGVQLHAWHTSWCKNQSGMAWQALADREADVRSGRLSTVVYIRDRNAGGQEVSGYVDYGHRRGALLYGHRPC